MWSVSEASSLWTGGPLSSHEQVCILWLLSGRRRKKAVPIVNCSERLYKRPISNLRLDCDVWDISLGTAREPECKSRPYVRGLRRAE